MVPMMLNTKWHCHFHKNIDVYFVILAAGISEWPLCEYESLTIGLYLTLLHNRPWDWNQCSFMVSLGHSLSMMYKTGDSLGGCVLCKFWEANQWVASMPECLVCDLLLHPPGNNFLIYHADDAHDDAGNVDL